MKHFKIALLLLMSACQAGEIPSDEADTNTRGLTKADSCESLLVEYRKTAIAELERGTSDFASCDDFYFYDIDTTAEQPSSETESTATNIQEEGVDEADTIKADGDYVFVATSTGADIFKTWPMEDFSRVASIDAGAATESMYLVNGRLLLLSQGDDSTLLTLADVVDPNQPVLLTSFTVRGKYVSSRMIEETLHLISYESPAGRALSFYNSLPDEFWDEFYREDCNDTKIKSFYDRAMTEAVAALNESISGYASDTAVCEGYEEKETDALAMLTSLRVEGSGFGASKTTLVAGGVTEVYASPVSVILAHGGYDGENGALATSLYRFSVDSENDLHAYTGHGSVPGTLSLSSIVGEVQSSFLMSEEDGYLRVTTNENAIAEDSSNNVYVLDASQGEMPVVGSLEGLAKGEQIYGARFVEDRLYLITFKKIDPLFVIDLVDPTAPTLKGELEMPGFSTYLHPLDEDHLIGIGRDADDMGDFAWYQGLKVSLYRVSSPSSDDILETPEILEDILIGSRGSESPVIEDHHGFTFDADSGLMALPLTLYEGGEGDWDSGTFSYNGVHLYRFSGEGIETVAEIELPEDSSMPLRTVISSDGERTGIFVLDSGNVYLYDLSDLSLKGRTEVE